MNASSCLHVVYEPIASILMVVLTVSVRLVISVILGLNARTMTIVLMKFYVDIMRFV